MKIISLEFENQECITIHGMQKHQMNILKAALMNYEETVVKKWAKDDRTGLDFEKMKSKRSSGKESNDFLALRKEVQGLTQIMNLDNVPTSETQKS